MGRSSSIVLEEGFEIRLIASRGYRRNIGVGRLLDHLQMAMSLAAELAHEQLRPDVAFVGYPPIEVAYVMSKWLRRAGVPYLVDVKDQWPDLFVEAVPAPLRLIARGLLAPYFLAGAQTMRKASALCSMSESFLEWSRRFAGRDACQDDIVVPLVPGVEAVSDGELRAAAQWWDRQGVLDDGRFRLAFIGTLSRAFDFETVASAARRCVAAGLDCEWVICGDGECRQQTVSAFDGVASVASVRFPGWIHQPQIIALSRRCSAFLAPYRNTPNFELNLPNKILDAMALGVPIITPLRGEVRRLLDESSVGVTYTEGDAAELAAAIGGLMGAGRCVAMAGSARELHRKRFSFGAVYGRLVERLEAVASTGKEEHG